MSACLGLPIRTYDDWENEKTTPHQVTLEGCAARLTQGWQSMLSAPRGRQALYWIVPSSNRSWGKPHLELCAYDCWASTDKAIAWMELPTEPILKKS